MRAVDTNILTRYFRADDAKQSALAHRVMTQDRVFIPKTVLLEFEAVMRYVYEHGRSDIEACLSTLLNLPNVLIEDEAQAGAAFQAYQHGLDWADALHLASCAQCDDLVTFDARRFARRAARLALKPPVTVPA